LIKLDDIAKRHNEWIKMATYLGAEFPEDAVQDVYLKLAIIQEAEGDLNRFEYKEGIVNTMYIFKMLQSRIVDEHRRKKHQLFDDIQFNPITDASEIEKSYAELMDSIKDIIDGFDEYNQMLLELYFVYGLSLRDIEKKTAIPLHSIFNTIKNCKIIIKNQVYGQYKDYCDSLSQKETISRSWGYCGEDNGSNWD